MKTIPWSDHNIWGVQYENESDILAQVGFRIRHKECCVCKNHDCEYCEEHFSGDGIFYTVTNTEWQIDSGIPNIRFKGEYKNFDEAFEEFHKQVNLEKEELIKNGY